MDWKADRSGYGAEEVYLWEKYFNENKAAHPGLEAQMRRHQKSKTGVPVAPKRICVCQTI